MSMLSLLSIADCEFSMSKNVDDDWDLRLSIEFACVGLT